MMAHGPVSLCLTPFVSLGSVYNGPPGEASRTPKLSLPRVQHSDGWWVEDVSPGTALKGHPSPRAPGGVNCNPSLCPSCPIVPTTPRGVVSHAIFILLLHGNRRLRDRLPGPSLRQGRKARLLSQTDMGSNPSLAASQPCDRAQVPLPH